MVNSGWSHEMMVDAMMVFTDVYCWINHSLPWLMVNTMVSNGKHNTMVMVTNDGLIFSLIMMVNGDDSSWLIMIVHDCFMPSFTMKALCHISENQPLPGPISSQFTHWYIQLSGLCLLDLLGCFQWLHHHFEDTKMSTERHWNDTDVNHTYSSLIITIINHH